MIKHVEFILNGLENTSSFVDTAVFAEQAEELGLKQVLAVEAVFDDEREDLVELFHGSAELEEES